MYFRYQFINIFLYNHILCVENRLVIICNNEKQNKNLFAVRVGLGIHIFCC